MFEHKAWISRGEIGKSAIADHHLVMKHNPDFESARVMLHQSNLLKRKIAEALVINSQSVVENNRASFSLQIFS